MASKIEQQQRDGISLWSVVDRASGKVIGDCGLQWEDEAHSVAGLGFRFNRAFWGRGYAFEAAGACLSAAFEQLELDRVVSGTDIRNARARHLLERLGMRYVRDGDWFGRTMAEHEIRVEDWAGDGARDAIPEHVARNRAHWDSTAANWVAEGKRQWAFAEPAWGIWAIAEAEVRMLPATLEGRDTIELGCGTAYVSAWLARRGARPVGIDNSPMQLETARILQRQHGIDFPLHLGNAETTSFDGASFDFAISEYGASIWCDPYRWIPEAARILRPGGQLSFLANSPIYMLFAPDQDGVPAGETLLRPYFGMHRFDWQDDPSVEFHLPHGEMLRLLRASGFEVVDMRELQAPAGANTKCSVRCAGVGAEVAIGGGLDCAQADLTLDRISPIAGRRRYRDRPLGARAVG